MIDRIEREAAVRYIREKLGDIARINVAVNNILHVMQGERNYPLTDAMCDLVKHLVKQNTLLMEQNLSLQSVVGKVAPHWGESASPAGKYQKSKTLRLGSFEEKPVVGIGLGPCFLKKDTNGDWVPVGQVDRTVLEAMNADRGSLAAAQNTDDDLPVPEFIQKPKE